MIQQDKPELLTNTFLESMKFLSSIALSRQLIVTWLQV